MQMGRKIETKINRLGRKEEENKTQEREWQCERQRKKEEN